MKPTTCVECWLPVSQKPATADRRVEVEPGRWAHRDCASPPTAEMTLLNHIFGHATRERIASDNAGFHWRCACGLTGNALDRSNKSDQQSSAREHKRTAWVQAPPPPLSR